VRRCAAHIEEDTMGRSPYQSEKRRKELARLKKQEEKRQRRFNKKHEGETAEGQPEGTGVIGPDGQPVDPPQDATTEAESENVPTQGEPGTTQPS
jgi:hypothetical protein